MITSVARVSFRLVTALVAVLVAVSAASVYVGAQIQPTNSLPSPYQAIENWAKLPEGRMWGSTAGVAIGPNGAVYVTNWVEHVLSPRRSNRRGRARHGELSTLASGAAWSYRRPSPSC